MLTTHHHFRRAILVLLLATVGGLLVACASSSAPSPLMRSVDRFYDSVQVEDCPPYIAGSNAKSKKHIMLGDAMGISMADDVVADPNASDTCTVCQIDDAENMTDDAKIQKCNTMMMNTTFGVQSETVQNSTDYNATILTAVTDTPIIAPVASKTVSTDDQQDAMTATQQAAIDKLTNDVAELQAKLAEAMTGVAAASS